jgi:FAD/FMN-containing dehydrogenase
MVDIEALRAELTGEVILPGDEGYEEARRIWNAMVDRRPALIAKCVGADDVIAALRFAREHELIVSVKGGGHSVAGKSVCEAGLMIDLSPMRGIEVDPAAKTVRAEGGVTWGEFDRATQAHGLAATGGVIPSTGIAGLTLGGGLGFLMRRFGLACDNLIAADLVTADGELIHVDEASHPDLLWGLCGGGGNFGIATSFEFQLHELGPTVLGGVIVHPYEHARDVMRFYREFVRTAPDELTVYCGLGAGEDGGLTVALVVCCSAPLEEGERLPQPLRAFGSPLVDTVAPVPYLAIQNLFETTYPPGRMNYWKSNFLDEISDDLIELMIEHIASLPSPHANLSLEHMGGAVKRLDSDATAFPDRDANFSLLVTSAWPDPADNEANIRWVREGWETLRPHAKQSVYVNYVDAGEDERVVEAYGPNYARVAALKAKYDPDNVFRHNHNVPPKA